MPSEDIGVLAEESGPLSGLESDKEASNGSSSPSRSSTHTPDILESVTGSSSEPTPAASEIGDNSKDAWDTEMDPLTKDLEEEEKKMAAENLAEEQQLRKKLEERDRDEKELKEKRYKRLMHLLNKSEFYSQFLLKQMESQEEQKKTIPKNRSKEDKENNSSEGNCSQDSTPGRGKKRKIKSNGTAAKRARNGKYNFGDVIDSDTVKANAANAQESNANEDIERSEQPRLFVNGTMRPYQLDGFSWLTTLYENGVNGILGDEMGLGKTIQCIALICHLVDKGVPGPFLVVGPLSTLPNWIAEFKRFAPSIPTVLYHGPEKVRTEKRRELKKLVAVEGLPIKIFPVVITSYEVATKDTNRLNQFTWRYICVDEGHRLKNHKCRLAKSLNSYPSSNRLLMTGTPLQNDLSELWALLNFLMPEIFDSLDVFESWFDVTEMMEDGSDEKIVAQEREKNVITTLMKILSPFFLRRVKKDVNLDLPPKKELLVYTPMTPTQWDIYEATLKRDINKFNEMKQETIIEEPTEYDERGRPIRKSKKNVDYKVLVDESDSIEALNRFCNYFENMYENQTPKALKPVQRTHALNIKLQIPMMQCRRIVNHPYLLSYPLNEDGSYKVDEEIVRSCGKLQVLDQLLGELYKRGHRVLIFSQMTMMMNIIEDYLTLRPKYKYKRLDGSRNIDDRQTDINEFNTDKSFFTFLISTRAGSLGINLATADTVIIYDSDWNPQCDLQAQDRCHRIGQTKPVLVLRLITANSVDERIVDRAATKRKLEKMIIQNGKFNDGNVKRREKMLEKAINVDELLELLKERDHDRIHNTKTGNVFSKAELNELLDRSDLVNIKSNDKLPSKKQHLRGVFKVLEEQEA